MLAGILWASYAFGPLFVMPIWAALMVSIVVQPVALVGALFRLCFWGPSLLLWFAYPQDYSFGKWLAPGFYPELVTP